MRVMALSCAGVGGCPIWSRSARAPIASVSSIGRGYMIVLASGTGSIDDGSEGIFPNATNAAMICFPFCNIWGLKTSTIRASSFPVRGCLVIFSDCLSSAKTSVMSPSLHFWFKGDSISICLFFRKKESSMCV